MHPISFCSLSRLRNLLELENEISRSYPELLPTLNNVMEDIRSELLASREEKHTLEQNYLKWVLWNLIRHDTQSCYSYVSWTLVVHLHWIVRRKSNRPFLSPRFPIDSAVFPSETLTVNIADSCSRMPTEHIHKLQIGGLAHFPWFFTKLIMVRRRTARCLDEPKIDHS